MNEGQIEAYMKNHQIDDFMLDITESLLSDRPPDPKRYLLDKLNDRIQEDHLASDGLKNHVHNKKRVTGGNDNNIIDVPGEHLIRLFESTRAITAEIGPHEAINIIIRETIKLLNCDRVSLFVYDEKSKNLVLTASNLENRIRVQPGQGIAGSVFTTGEPVNIPDCYNDARFDPSFDRKTDYKTRNMLVIPIKSYEGSTVGVLQAINKLDALEFSSVDEILLGHLTQHAGIALRNANVYKDAIVSAERANGLLSMVQSLSKDLGQHTFLLSVTMHAAELTQADKCTVFLVDEIKNDLWTIVAESGKELRVPRTRGLVGECCEEKKIINIIDAYEDGRFNKSMDEKLGYRTQSILVYPVLDDLKQTLAIIEMFNKKDFDFGFTVFTDDDINIMKTFVHFLAHRLSALKSLSWKSEDASKTQKTTGEDTATATKPLNVEPPPILGSDLKVKKEQVQRSRQPSKNLAEKKEKAPDNSNEIAASLRGKLNDVLKDNPLSKEDKGDDDPADTKSRPETAGTPNRKTVMKSLQTGVQRSVSPIVNLNNLDDRKATFETVMKAAEEGEALALQAGTRIQSSPARNGDRSRTRTLSGKSTAA